MESAQNFVWMYGHLFAVKMFACVYAPTVACLAVVSTM